MIHAPTILFITVSVAILGYIFQAYIHKKRVPALIELLVFGIYLFVLIYIFFYSMLQELFNIIGIESPTTFLVYFAILTLVFTCFLLYETTEVHRKEITQLTREIALMKHKMEKQSGKKSKKL